METDQPSALLGEMVEQRTEKVVLGKDLSRPYVGLEHMASNSPDLVGFARADTSVSTNSIFERDDILFGKLRPNLKKCVLAPFPGYCSTDIIVLRARYAVVPAFAAKVLQSDLVFNHALKTAVGTKMPRTSWGSLAALRVFCPVDKEQRRIAAILDTLDDAIRRTEQVIAKLQQMKEGLLHDLLTRGVDEQGQLRDANETPEAFTRTELGVLPKGWQTGGFSTFRTLDRELIKTGPFGTAMNGRKWADTGVPVVTIGSLGERTVIRENLLFLGLNDAKAFSSYELCVGDIVFSRVADVGRSLVIRDAEAGWIMSSNLMRISLDCSRVCPDFVQLAIVYADSSRRQIRRLANAGGREVVNTAVLSQLRFAWPPLHEQIRLCRIVEAHDAEVAAESQRLDKLRTLKRGLSHDLLTGRVRVPVAVGASA